MLIVQNQMPLHALLAALRAPRELLILRIGPDGISGYMLKGTAQSIASSVTMLFNMTIRSGRVPKMWKVPSVVPIPKTATSTDNPSNYRPISLLPVVSKLLEKHIYSIVFEHLAERKLLSVDQWGFCPGKSTVTALTSTFHNVFQLLEAGFDVSLVFFDLHKAFDSVPHLYTSFAETKRY